MIMASVREMIIALYFSAGSNSGPCTVSDFYEMARKNVWKILILFVREMEAVRV